MKINVGSKNNLKITAIRDTILMYPNLFLDPEIVGVDVDIDLFGHPKNIEETVKGAIARAEKAFIDCDFSFGLEGGMIEVPHSKTGYMELSACAIYDGQESYLGLSSAFEWPTEVCKMIVSGQADASQAFKQLAMTDQEKLGAVDGGISGMLTKGRQTREEQIKQSVIMALIQLENPGFY